MPSTSLKGSPSAAPRPLRFKAATRQFSLPPLPDSHPVAAQLQRVLNSSVFLRAQRSRLFLRYIVQHELAHLSQPIKEYNIALDVFGRDTYDPAVNNTVRVEAARLRARLLEYYAGPGCADPIVIHIPKGSYRAVIQPRIPVPQASEPPAPPALHQLAEPRRTSLSTPPAHLWALPVAFLLGAWLGHRASH